MINYYLNAIFICNTHTCTCTTLNLKTKIILTKSDSFLCIIHKRHFNQAQMCLCVAFVQLSLCSSIWDATVGLIIDSGA